VELFAPADASVPVLHVELLASAPVAETSGLDDLAAVQAAAAADAEAGDEDEDEDSEPAAAAQAPVAAQPRGGRALDGLAAGVLGLACGAAAIGYWSHQRHEREMAAVRAAAREAIAAERSAARSAAASSGGIRLRVVPDERAQEPQAEPPSLERYAWLPSSAALPQAAAVALTVAAPSPPPPSEELAARPAAPPLAVPQVTVDARRTIIVIPTRGTGEGLRASPLNTPGVSFTLPKARPLIPGGHHAIAHGLARRIWLRKDGEGMQVRVIYRSPGIKHIVEHDDLAGLTITLERTR
jgi:hypothetical protein